ncbi:MAG: acetyl-CoA C-acyltransferase [Limnochordaceae bacterium]|nr:acetyl-CoA C-acyltransferase [Limnochordaceae bacterium]
MMDAVIVSAVRTPVAKARRGALKDMRADELAALVIREAVQRVPGLDPAEVDDVILGCAMPEADQGLNVARIAAIRAGLSVSVPAMTVNRFCSSGLQSIAMAAERIMTGAADVVVAGGVESMSRVPMTGFKFSPNPYLVEHYPEVYMAMGHTAEEVARRYGVSREDQDAYALRSHQRAARAIDAGAFRDETVPVPLEDGARFEVDEGVRRDTSMEALAALRPAFTEGGTVTAGNSSQMSDGAAAVVVMSSRRAQALGLEPLGIFRGFAVAGVPPEIMGIGPVEAVPKLLRRLGLRLDEIGLVELNEAFAAQTLAVIRQLGMDEERVNVNGGAIALGHPLGATGAKLTATLLYEMARRRVRWGLVTMCVGGGMGAAGLFEAA